jgi:hypothetical protein
MSDELSAASTGHVRAAPRFVLATVCCAIFVAFIVLMAHHTAIDPLHALRNVSFSVIGVCVNFAVCLGSALTFGLWVRRERAAARK